MHKKLFFLFLDGVGYLEEDSNKQIFPYTLIKKLIQRKIEHISWGADANLGVDGIPQSGTGQVSILCGINAPAKIGKHFGPFAHPDNLEDIITKNIFEELKKNNILSCFVNAYPQKYFDTIQNGKYQGVFAKSFLSTYNQLNTYNELLHQKALSGDITNKRWLNMGYNIDTISPLQASKIILDLGATYDFIVYEYFFTDHIGHERIKGKDKKELLSNLEEFILNLAKLVIDNNYNLLLCSDHGNIEDLSTKLHTNNPAFYLAVGSQKQFFFESIKDISQTKNAILKYYGVKDVES